MANWAAHSICRRPCPSQVSAYRSDEEMNSRAHQHQRGRAEFVRSIPKTDRSDEGATLVLALIFMVVAAMLVLALVTWSGNDLQTVAAFRQGRSLNYAANSAVETAIQDVRYNPQPTACPSSGLSIPVNTLTMIVWCIDSFTGTNVQTEGGTAASRVITFYACSNSAFAQNTCGPNKAPYSSSKPPPYLEATVTYDDYTSPTQIGSSILCTSTCGANVTINTWIFRNVAI